MARKRAPKPPDPQTTQVTPVNLATLCVACGLPRPEPEVVFAPPRKWAWDWAWEPWKVALEIQGATWQQGRHTRGEGYAEDQIKSAEGQLRGWLVIAMTTDQVQSGLAFVLIRRALEGRGWTPKEGE